MDTLILVIGVVLMVTGGLGLALNLAARAAEAARSVSGAGSRLERLGDVVVKLSERSIAPTVAFLLGLLLYDPVLFGYLWPGS